MKGRRRLGFGGHIGVSLVVNSSGQVLAGPEVAVDGLPAVEEDGLTLEKLVRNIVTGTLKSIPAKRRSDPELIENALHRALRGEVTAYWGRKPNVAIFVHRV